MKKESKLLNINDNQIYCNIQGCGKTVILIHGAGCDSDFFEDTSTLLSKYFKVITYDRRGYSRSNGVIETDFFNDSIEDLFSIIKLLTPNQKVILVGCSAGALIAMKFSERYPELTSMVIAHEPPFLNLLPSGHSAIEILNQVDEFIEIKKFGRAANRFLLLMEEGEDNKKIKSEETMIREEKNMKYFMQYEFKSTFDKELSFKFDDKLNLIIGAGDAHRENYHFIYAKEYTKENDISFVHFPGKHNCAYDLPFEFASTIHGIITLNTMIES